MSKLPKASSRELARTRRLELDAERAQRDARIDTVTATYIDDDDRRQALLEELGAIEVRMSQSVAELLDDMKEPASRVCALLGIDAKELRRLRALTPDSATEPASSHQGKPASKPAVIMPVHQNNDDQTAPEEGLEQLADAVDAAVPNDAFHEELVGRMS